MKKIHYSWFICAGGTLMLFCTGGLAVTGFSVYSPYLISQIGISNFQASAIPFIRSLFTLLGMSFVTFAIRKLEIRRVVSLSLLLCSAAFAVFGCSLSFPGLALGAAVSGLAMGFGGMISCSILISRWFISHNGLALGICMAATGLATFVASPIITAVIENFSLRTAFFTEALFILAAAIITYAILRSNPSCKNLEPLGAGGQGEEPAPKAYAGQNAPSHLYFLMCVSILIFGMSANNIHSHLSVLYSSVGLDTAKVSWIVSTFGISLAAGKAAYGQISDKIGVFRASLIMYSLVLVGNGLSCFAQTNSYPASLAITAVMGFGLSVTSVAASAYALHISTEEEYPKTVSRFQFMNTLGGLIFGTIPGILADITGSYIPSFALMFACSLIGAASALILYRAIQHSML